MRLTIMGPPGAGKGTQAQVLASALNVPAISTGDIFRANVQQGTDLGAEATFYMNSGNYVPDDLTNEMVRRRIAEPDAERGFLLDGYPRTLAQVHELDQMLVSALDAVLVLSVDQETLVERLLRRATLEGRADDTIEVIRQRLTIYEQETAPLVEEYSRRGLATEIDGWDEPSTVTRAILASLVPASDRSQV